MCIRHELSPATSTSAPVSRTWRALSEPIATEVSAFFIAKVPPKPQHSVAAGSSRSVSPRTCWSSRVGPVAHPEHPQRVAGRVVGDRVREVGTDVGHPEHVDQELAELVHLRRQLGDGALQAGVPRALGDDRVLVPGTSGARARRRHDRVVPLEGTHEGAHGGHGLVEVAGVHHRLAAAGLLLRELHVDAEPPQQRDHGLARVGEQRVVEAGDQQRDPHAHRRHAPSEVCLGVVPGRVDTGS